MLRLPKTPELKQIMEKQLEERRQGILQFWTSDHEYVEEVRGHLTGIPKLTSTTKWGTGGRGTKQKATMDRTAGPKGNVK